MIDSTVRAYRDRYVPPHVPLRERCRVSHPTYGRLIEFDKVRRLDEVEGPDKSRLASWERSHAKLGKLDQGVLGRLEASRRL